MDTILCIKCNNPMPELRKSKYGYNFCVNCSTVGSKRGTSVMRGEGDHTWVETLIMDENCYIKNIQPEIRYEVEFGTENE